LPDAAVNVSVRVGARTRPAAPSMPIAIGKSKADPSFFTSAGARLIVMCCAGRMYPQLGSAAFTRSLLSRTAVSGSPTVMSASFSPELRSTSTDTG